MIYKISSNQKHHFERRGEIKLHSVIVIMPPIANVEFNNFIDPLSKGNRPLTLIVEQIKIEKMNQTRNAFFIGSDFN